MRHHGFSCSSLYTVTPEQAQENLLIESVKRVFVPVVSWRVEEAGKGNLPASSTPDIPMKLFAALS